VKGLAGAKISLRYGEAIYPNGKLNVNSTVATQIRKGGLKGGSGAPETAWQEDDYILKGEGVEEWQPRFTFHGFRYVEITGWPGKPTEADVEGLRMNSDLPENGHFTCSNDMFNQLHQNIQWTFLSNVFSVQSDCPGREKMGYGADMVVSSGAFLYNFNMANFYGKAIRDFANEQQPDGAMTEIAPYTGIADEGYGGESGPLGWELNFAYLQKQLYDFYGDTRIIEHYYERFQRQIEFLRRKSVNDLFDRDIGDHASLDAKPVALSASAFYYQHVCLAAQFAGILQKTADSVEYAALAKKIRAAIINTFQVKNTGRFDNGTQAAQLFALYYGLVPQKDSAFDVLIRAFARTDWHVSTGIFATKMIFDVMRENDSNELAYKLANQRDFPGWGYMMAKGATTLWETWDGSESLNHPMFGSIDEWFYRSLLGINAAAPGFRKIKIKPQPAGDLQWAKGNYHSINGPIACDWRKDGKRFILAVSIPPNTRAEIWIPAKADGSLTEGGKPVLVSHYEKGYAVVETGSGLYSFMSENAF
jgi:alpha-L-rhamnosidase